MRASAAKVRSRWYYVYILRCADQGTYIGCTTYIKDRIKRHSMSQVPATKISHSCKDDLLFRF
jgi:predicted GIY-YIG superfamily endonuclease